jgi:hypothetical protein
VDAVFLALAIAQPKEFARMVDAIAILVTRVKIAACLNCVLATALIVVFATMGVVSVTPDTLESIVPKLSLVRSIAPREAYA